MFYKHEAFDSGKKNLFTESIEKIRMVAICDKNTINIEKFVSDERVYKEILFLQIELKDKAQYKKISEIVHQVVPNPTVILFTHENEFLVSTAPKRLSKQEKGKVVIEDVYHSIWVNPEDTDNNHQNFLFHLNLKKCRFDNLHIFYSDITKAVILSSFIGLTGSYSYSKNTELEAVTELSRRHREIEDEIVFCTNEEKRMKNFGDKVANHQRLLDAQEKLAIIKQEILDLHQ